MAKKGLDAASLQWAKNLATALRAWLKSNGYRNSTVLARELGVPVKKWAHLVGGNTISLTEYYAKIYLRTGLPEADPRLIPPQRNGYVRAWAEKQYQHWLSKQGEVKKSQTIPISVRPTLVGGGVLESLLEELHQTCRSVERLTQLLQPTGGSLDEFEILVEKIMAPMKRAISGTAADRDRFQTRYGAAVARLLALADALSEKDPRNREAKAQRLRTYGEVAV